MEAYGGVEIEEMDYEEDTDDIPLMKFDYGKTGKHLLVVDNKFELDFYLPKLRKNLGDDFSYICMEWWRTDWH